MPQCPTPAHLVVKLEACGLCCGYSQDLKWVTAIQLMHCSLSSAARTEWESARRMSYRLWQGSDRRNLISSSAPEMYLVGE